MSYLVKKDKLNDYAHSGHFRQLVDIKWHLIFNYAYSISKAGLKAMVETLACELGYKFIRVNSIAPGMVDTPLKKKLNNDDYFTKIDKSKYILGKKICKGR